MAAADRACIAAGTQEAALIARAGRAVARIARTMLGGTYGRRVVVVAGKGNNGADGDVAAASLMAYGVPVHVYRVADGIDQRSLARDIDRSDLVIDAMFGTGFRGSLEGDACAVAEALDERDVPVLAIDIPSGVDGATGAVRGAAVHADVTVCFMALKPGLVLPPGAQHAGDIHVVDIDIPLPDVALHVATASDVSAWLPARAPDTHKWEVGGVFVAGGSRGMTGAPMLVSRAALRAGAGIVVCGLPGDDAAARASGGEVITRALPATASGAMSEIDTSGLTRFRACVIGPGLGTDPATVAAVRQSIAQIAAPIVLDADGLNALAGDTAPLAARAAVGPTVITPHAGEFARLTGGSVSDDRVAAARRLAADAQCVVVLKGSRTVIAAPDGRAAINTTGGPWLATAGTGDVLAGIVGASLARGMHPFEAAVASTWLHGRAADVAGHAGLVAGDVIEGLPRILAALED